MSAHAFSRLRFYGRRTGLLTLLLVQTFPQALAIVALFLLMIRVGDVDGATHAQIFFRIILPLVRPVLAVVGLLAFVFIVNDFVVA